jgi:hypothetical protein
MGKEKQKISWLMFVITVNPLIVSDLNDILEGR